ncbi:MAG: hypothetical protein H0T51_24360 [Pirellulales bacterium]|nr:hypothetical protein [Pirellulales bacterium]
MWVTDRKLRVTAIGGGALGALALTPDGLIGRGVLEALGASDKRDPVIQAHHSALDGRPREILQEVDAAAKRIVVGVQRRACGFEIAVSGGWTDNLP